MAKSIISSLLILGLFLSCAVNPVTGKRELSLISEEREIAMGKEYDPQISAMYGVYDDKKLLDYVNNLGQKMAKISHRPNLKYEIKVMDSPVINAFAVPGGYVYITRGILAYLNSEAELAGVMGHEIGHITAKHSVSQMSKAQLAQLGMGLGSVFIEGFDQYAGLAGQAVGLLFLKYGRDDERQSDKLGVEYATKVGYDAREMANFFKVLDNLNKSSSSSLPDFLSTHPNPADRYNDVRRRAVNEQKKYPGKNFVINRDQYMKMIDGLIYGENPRQGFIENNIFYHPDLRFLFPTPQGWKINNLPTQVQMVSSDEQAIMIFKLEAAETPKKAASKFISDNKLTLLSQKNLKVNGFDAEEVIASTNTEQGVFQLIAYYIKKDKNVYHFLGYTSEQNYGSYESLFKNTMRGFKNLTDRSKINRQPDRLRIKKVTQNTNLQNALKSFGVSTDALAYHAQLNGGRALTDNIAAGQLLKIVQKGK